MIGEKNTVFPVLCEETELQPAGSFTQIDGESYYSIHDYDRLDPFLMSIVSDSDHWMYISSLGGLTAGRANPEHALFPYDSEDKLHQCHSYTGPRTALWVSHPDGREALWEPFTQSSADHFKIRRHLYKSELGNSLIFEEVNQDLELTFRYRWSFSEIFGFVRRSTLANAGDMKVSVSLMDGLLNIMPYGISPLIHQQRHCLADAYKHSQVDSGTGLGIYSLSSMIIDRPEPGETMYATCVWGHGLESPSVCLRPEYLDAFRCRKPIRDEPLLKGRKGAYLLKSSLQVGPGQLHHWHIVADVVQDQKRVVKLRESLRTDGEIIQKLEADCRKGSQSLRRNVASADGLQATGHQMMPAHHFANVLFNNMRGGVFNNHYDVSRSDLANFIRSRNNEVAERHSDFLGQLPEVCPIRDLLDRAGAVGDADLQRLCYEYLPLYFSRRHGDPSRPWNHFDIRLKDEQGNRVLAYQGNWRDIFQNWEALCFSYPGFLPSIIAKFVNASTGDGFNPYRITSDGIDWEVVDEDDPWSNIGYWGDHQIVYLLRLLESLRGYYPNELGAMMTREVFSYADVPYSIKPYEQVLEDPTDTIVYNRDRAHRVTERVNRIGADGRLLVDVDGKVLHVTLSEKLLVAALSKLSNLVLDGGLWLNTQRPEWNDANNALVGNGLSVVTLCYLRRYLAFCRALFAEVNEQSLNITGEVARWLDRVCRVLETERAILDSDRTSDIDRKRLLDELGLAFSDYRQVLYEKGLTGKTAVKIEQIDRLIGLALDYVDHSIHANRRDDGMYHAYNLMELSTDRDAVSLRHMYEMLEGQVAVLSSGVLTTGQALGVLEALPCSAMYRADQDSYMLYPDRELLGFLEKNIAPRDRVEASALLVKLIERGDGRVIFADAEDNYRFASNLVTIKQLAEVLEDLALEGDLRGLVNRDAEMVKELYEYVYNHKAFTGRSGTMYGYEGLGCIYWHMVAKLLLAAQECYLRAIEDGESADITGPLADAYYRVRDGLGFNKTPVQYGAFPTDPYSHTPGHSGARQPGMTGQVKEEIITRHKELGVTVDRGALRFAPTLIRQEEFLKTECQFQYYRVDGQAASIELPPGSIGITVCQVPVVYHLTDASASIAVTYHNKQTKRVVSDSLPPDISRRVFDRTGEVERIDVTVSRDAIRD